jgi:hypothetical protein
VSPEAALGVMVTAAARTEAMVISDTSIASARAMSAIWRSPVPGDHACRACSEDERSEGNERRDHGEVPAPGDAERQQHDVSGLVRGEDVAEPEVAGGVDEASCERQRQERFNKRIADVDGGRRQRSLLRSTWLRDGCGLTHLGTSNPVVIPCEDNAA